MKTKIKDLKGLLPMGKAALKHIKGGVAAGGGTCYVTYTNNGVTTTSSFTAYGSCSQQSSFTNGVCVAVLEMGNSPNDRCRYDCACDGLGQ
jgi:hypothetical protein